jgi:hypothetical protein
VAQGKLREGQTLVEIASAPHETVVSSHPTALGSLGRWAIHAHVIPNAPLPRSGRSWHGDHAPLEQQTANQAMYRTG